MRLALYRQEDSTLVTRVVEVDGDKIPDRLKLERVDVEVEQRVIGEPLIWSHITDGLPEDHPLAYEAVFCSVGDGELLHASNNECMQTWVETGRGAYCLVHFVEAVAEVVQGETYHTVEEGWALRRGQ